MYVFTCVCMHVHVYDAKAELSVYRCLSNKPTGQGVYWGGEDNFGRVSSTMSPCLSCCAILCHYCVSFMQLPQCAHAPSSNDYFCIYLNTIWHHSCSEDQSSWNSATAILRYYLNYSLNLSLLYSLVPRPRGRETAWYILLLHAWTFPLYFRKIVTFL